MNKKYIILTTVGIVICIMGWSVISNFIAQDNARKVKEHQEAVIRFNNEQAAQAAQRKEEEENLQKQKDIEFISTHSILCQRPTPDMNATLYPENFVSPHCINDTTYAIKDGTIVKLVHNTPSQLDKVGESISPDRLKVLIRDDIAIYSFIDRYQSVDIWVKDSSNPNGELLLDNESSIKKEVQFTIGDSVNYHAVASNTIPDNLKSGACLYFPNCYFREVIPYKKN